MSKAPEYPQFNTQTPELHERIATVIAAIPPDYWARPKKNKLFTDSEAAFIRLCDWGEPRGFFLLKNPQIAGQDKGREALAQTSQLLNSIELPFRNS
jgi:hypothetical protein